MTDERRAGAEQEVDVFVAGDVPHPAAPPRGDDQIGRRVPERAGRQHPPCQFHQRLLLLCPHPGHGHPPRFD